MDILLAHGYFLALDAAEQRVMRPHPPLGLLYLSSHLKASGVAVGVFDATFRTLEDFATTLERERPPVVGIAVNLMTKRNALRMIALAKRRGAQVVIGGPDPPHHAESYLNAGADVVVIGEPFKYVGEPITATHGTPYTYDTNVPIIIMGRGVKAGRYLQESSPADIAPTLAALLGIQAPSSATGRILTEAMGLNVR